MNFTYILNLLFIPSSVLNLYFDNNTSSKRVTNIRVNDDNLAFSEFFNYYYDNYYLRKYDDKYDDKYIEIDNFFYYFIQG